jgi:peptide/nickel transport system ATP-binding protein
LTKPTDAAILSEVVLSVDSLSTEFTVEDGVVRVVDKVSFELTAGATLGIVGESGCGKSVTALSIMGLLPKPAGRVVEGRVLLNGLDLLLLPKHALQQIRGRRVSMIFQEPMTALNPVQPIGRQLIETLRLHGDVGDRRAARSRGVELLAEVGIPAPDSRLDDYPHQLSGGMRQRVLIAIALACRPDVLIADEPTTALDVTIQAQILALIARLQRERGMSVIFITHDLGVIAEIADQVVVMYAGRVVETAGVAALFANPRHPYTRGLIASMPQLQHVPKSRLPTIAGMVPALSALPQGCRFSNRCGHATAVCSTEPPLDRADMAHGVACHHWRELGA